MLSSLFRALFKCCPCPQPPVESVSLLLPPQSVLRCIFSVSISLTGLSNCIVCLAHPWDLTQTVRAKSLQSCPTVCDTMDCSLPGSYVHAILQAKVLEWAVISSFGGSS